MKRVAGGRTRAEDAAHHLHPISNPALLAEHGARVITHGKGAYLFTDDGHALLDAVAGLASVPLGYSNDAVREAAADQAERLPYYHTFWHMTNAPVAELSRTLARLTPAGFTRFFYSTSGSEGIETAVKLSWAHWIRNGRPEKRKVLSRHRAYHGNTIFTTSLTGIPHYHEHFGRPLDLTVHLSSPYSGDFPGLSPSEITDACVKELAEVIQKHGADMIAAFVIEAVQASGGCIVPPKDYCTRMTELCRAHDIHIIDDEVICGFGRTGELWGQDTFGFESDFIVLAKGLSNSYFPMSAVGISDPLMDEWLSTGDDFVHGFTGSGHPVGCAVASATIAELERDDLLGRVRNELAPYFASRLREFAHHELVREVRIGGLLAAIELHRDRVNWTVDHHEELADPVCQRAIAQGVITRANDASILMSPPFILTHAQVDMLVDTLRSSLDAMQREGRLTA